MILPQRARNQITKCSPLSATAWIFFTPFSKTISLFSRRFFQKILSLCMACIQERLVIKSGLWWRAYGSVHNVKNTLHGLKYVDCINIWSTAFWIRLIYILNKIVFTALTFLKFINERAYLLLWHSIRYAL